MGIVVIGAVFVDIKGYPEARYMPTGRNAGRVEQVHGGVGRNVVEDIANCELRPTFLSLVDESGIGTDVVQKLRSHKVNTDYMEAKPNGMGTWLVVFDNDGDVAGSISQRPDLSPIAQILDEKGDEIFQDADSIIIEIDLEKETVKRVFKLAEKYHKPVYAVVSNMNIALERRDFLQSIDCFVCNQQEFGILFADDYMDKTPQEMVDIVAARVHAAQIPSMIVTMGSQGAVYSDVHGDKGYCPARKVEVKDTAGAGDAFCAGAAVGLTYGKGLQEACQIGSQLVASVIITSENVCPRFRPRELGLDVEVK